MPTANVDLSKPPRVYRKDAPIDVAIKIVKPAKKQDQDPNQRRTPRMG